MRLAPVSPEIILPIKRISKVGEKGQIVIPKEVRDIFDINPGDSLIVLADSKKGIALVKSDVIEAATNNILGGSNDKDK